MSQQKMNEANVCGICLRDKKENVEAHFWCADCCLHICHTCYDEHKTNRVKQYHLCTSLENLQNPKLHKSPSKNYGWAAMSSALLESSHCRDYEDGCLECTAYCYDHCLILCSLCVLRSHKDCKNIKDLRYVSTSMKTANMTKNIHGKLNKFVKQIVVILDEISHQQDLMVNKKEEIIITASDITENISTNLAKLQRPVYGSIEKMHKRNILKINEEIETCRYLKKDSRQDLDTFHKVQNNGSRLIEYVLRLRVKLKTYEDRLKNIYFCVDNVTYIFVKDYKTQEMISCMKSLGEIKFQPCHLTLPPFLSSEKIIHLNERKMKKIVRLSARVPEDKTECYITGCLFITDDRILIADKNNSCLKLFTDSGEILSILELEGEPWDITCLNDDFIAVTLPTKKTIQVVDVSDNLTLDPAAELVLDYECWGIAAMKERVYLTCDPLSSAPSLRILSYSGKEISCLTTLNDKPIFSAPYHVSVVEFPGEIFVSDPGGDCIVGLTEDMNVKFCYKNSGLKYPAGISSDHEGNVYICGLHSNNIQQLTNNGKLIRELANSHDDIESPRLINILHKTDKIIINHGKMYMTIMQLY